MIKVLETVVRDLNHILFQGKNLQFRFVRRFVVDMFMLDYEDVTLYSAMLAPKDQVFFQDRNSADWQLLDANTTRHEIENASKYQW